jgi:hypothetical protein
MIIYAALSTQSKENQALYLYLFDLGGKDINYTIFCILQSLKKKKKSSNG